MRVSLCCLLVTLLLALVAGSLGGCGSAEHAARSAVAASGAESSTATGGAPQTGVTTEDSASEIDPSFETMLVPVHDVEVVARLDGLVTALDVEEGQRVQSGTRLAQLDDRERRAASEECEAVVARAAASWERARRLHDQSLISDVEFIQARSDWQVATARRDKAQIELEHCAVRAPFAGVVAVRRVQVGQMVKEGDRLFRISDPDLLRAELLLPESRLGTVRSGQAVTLIPAAGAAPATARVTRVNPLVDPASGTFRVVIDFDNRQARLPAGVSARVALGSLPPARR